MRQILNKLNVFEIVLNKFYGSYPSYFCVPERCVAVSQSSEKIKLQKKRFRVFQTVSHEQEGRCCWRTVANLRWC